MRISAYLAIFGLLLALLTTSCKEINPHGDEFCWTQTGDRLALVSLESRELLVASAEQDTLANIFVIDDLADPKGLFHAPAWSDHGNFLLYGKSTTKDFRIFVYSLADSGRQELAQIKFRSENDRSRLIAPFWTLGSSQVIWVDWIGEQKTLYAQKPDAKPPRVLYSCACDHLQPQTIPGQEAIAFSLQISGNSARNGLWMVPLAGGQPKQIYACDRLVNYCWAPDGSQIALVCALGEIKSNSGYELISINPAGTDRKQLALFDHEIATPAWSPDGQKIAVFEASDSLKNIWIVETRTGESTCLTFDNADNFWGWGGSDALYYTVKPLEQPPILTKEESDLLETIANLLGEQIENHLVMLKNFKPGFLDQNVNTFRLHPNQKAWAVYKGAQISFIQDSIYYPVVRFSDSQILIIARNKETSIAAADQMYQMGNYQAALDFLTVPFDLDLNSDNALAPFNADTILASNPEVNQVKDQQSSLDFWRVMATLRKLGKNQVADWLLNQNIRMFDYCRLRSKDSTQNIDDFLWESLFVNSRYGEFSQGLKDLDQIFQLDPDDSLFAYAIYSHQAYLALLGKLPTMAHLKLKAAIATMPETEQARKDILDALRFFQQLKMPKKSKALTELYEAYLTHIPGDAKIYAQIGELYEGLQQPDRAFSAYQKSVVQDGEQDDIWHKIFMLAQTD